jgi:hypothetical protein
MTKLLTDVRRFVLLGMARKHFTHTSAPWQACWVLPFDIEDMLDVRNPRSLSYLESGGSSWYGRCITEFLSDDRMPLTSVLSRRLKRDWNVVVIAPTAPILCWADDLLNARWQAWWVWSLRHCRTVAERYRELTVEKINWDFVDNRVVIVWCAEWDGDFAASSSFTSFFLPVHVSRVVSNEWNFTIFTR